MKKLASCICISHKKNKSSTSMDFTKSTFRVYEIVQPQEKYVCKDKYDQIKLQIPGFKKEDIRVKFTNGTALEISGERLLGNKKWSSFKKDYLTPDNCVTEEIRASFDDGLLHITMPKKIITSSSTTSAEMVGDQDVHEEEKKKILCDEATSTVEMIADNVREQEKQKDSSANSTITNMTDDAMSVTDEIEEDSGHLQQNDGKSYADGVKEMEPDKIEDAMSRRDYAEDANGIKKLDDADDYDMTEYAVNPKDLVVNMVVASLVILMLVFCNMKKFICS